MDGKVNILKIYIHISKTTSIFRGKHWCLDKDVHVTLEDREFIFVYRTYHIHHIGGTGVWKIDRSQPKQLENQVFPGVKDLGTPLVTNEYGHNTIVGIFALLYKTRDKYGYWKGLELQTNHLRSFHNHGEGP